MKKLTAKQTVRRSLRATKKFMSKLGGRPTAASGAWLEKGDGRVPGKFRVETKCPPTAKYRFTWAEWKKLWNAAVQDHEIAVFHLKLDSVELVVLRTVDRLALGTKSTMARQYGPSSVVHKGMLLSKTLWMAIQPADEIEFSIADDSGLRRDFTIIPASTFLKLTENAC